MQAVTLTWDEALIAAAVGIVRQLDNLREGRRETHGAPMTGAWERHVEGAAGEMAAAKYLGLFWSGAIGDLKADDVGPYQVRTCSREGHRLIIHETDPDDRAFVLVAGMTPAFKVCGWILGRDAKQPQYWSEPVPGRAAFFVPTEALRPMSELI